MFALDLANGLSACCESVSCNCWDATEQIDGDSLDVTLHSQACRNDSRILRILGRCQGAIGSNVQFSWVRFHWFHVSTLPFLESSRKAR